MPKFDTTKGSRAFIPAVAVSLVENAPGGLDSVITFSLPGGRAGQVEVKGTCDSVADAVLAELVGLSA